MSATNKTTYYELPIFIGSDKPSWLSDWNMSMQRIDESLHEMDVLSRQANSIATQTQEGFLQVQEQMTALSETIESELETIIAIGGKCDSNEESILAIENSVSTITETMTSLASTVNALSGTVETLGTQVVEVDEVARTFGTVIYKATGQAQVQKGAFNVAIPKMKNGKYYQKFMVQVVTDYNFSSSQQIMETFFVDFNPYVSSGYSDTKRATFWLQGYMNYESGVGLVQRSRMCQLQKVDGEFYLAFGNGVRVNQSTGGTISGENYLVPLRVYAIENESDVTN